MSAFDTVAASGTLESIDLHFAHLIRRQAVPSEADLLALTAGLLSRERGHGHTCLALDDWAGRPIPTESGVALPPLPDAGTWRRALLATPLVDDGAGSAPLVLDSGGRLYLARYWHAEQRLALALRRRLSAPLTVDSAALEPLFRQLFPELALAPTPPSGQSIAAATALASRAALISGGPGTGKTTLVGRLLALWLIAEPEMRIALAAPTGKAAARLGEALAAQSEQMPISDQLKASLPSKASTLHRLLGYQPRTDRFRHNESRPLAIDALVIDEVSMVDLLLMDAAIYALPPDARLLLLGDKDQLTSVETGSVFGDLCHAAHLDSMDGRPTAHSRHFANFFRQLSGRDLPSDDGSGRPGHRLRDAAVELTTSFRFRDHPGIGELASAVRLGDTRRAIQVLEDPSREDVALRDPTEDATAILTPILPSLNAYLAAASPAQALERLAAFRVLCARRQGPWGIERLNVAIERHLATAGHPIQEGFYPARPILITSNDYPLQLFNGDLGICWAEASTGRLWAFFPGTSGQDLRRLSLARLPPHETAWAMTVHKSQGSEFDRVLLVLGDTDSRVLTRDLLYTGATRARSSVFVVASHEVLRGAIARRIRRVSGLADALADPSMESEGPRRSAPELPPAPTAGTEPLRAPESFSEAKPPEPSPSSSEGEGEPPDSLSSGQLSLFGS